MLIFSVDSRPRHLLCFLFHQSGCLQTHEAEPPLTGASSHRSTQVTLFRLACDRSVGEQGKEYGNMGKKKRWLFCFAGLVAAPKTALPLWFSWTPCWNLSRFLPPDLFEAISVSPLSLHTWKWIQSLSLFLQQHLPSWRRSSQQTSKNSGKLHTQCCVVSQRTFSIVLPAAVNLRYWNIDTY